MFNAEHEAEIVKWLFDAIKLKLLPGYWWLQKIYTNLQVKFLN